MTYFDDLKITDFLHGVGDFLCRKTSETFVKNIELP